MSFSSLPLGATDLLPGEHLIAACGPITVINLPERTDRYREVEDQLQRLGLSFGHPQVRHFPAHRPNSPEGFSSIGARGCFLSHLDVLRLALSDGGDCLILCEDDLNFAHELPKRAAEFARIIDQGEWDILYGFLPEELKGKSRDAAPGLIEIAPEVSIQCSHIIAFKRSAIALLVPYLEAILQRPPGHPDGGPMHVDGAYNWFRRAHPELRVLGFSPELGYQRSSMTNVSPLGAKDRIPVLRTVVGLARRLRNGLKSG